MLTIHRTRAGLYTRDQFVAYRAGLREEQGMGTDSNDVQDYAKACHVIGLGHSRCIVGMERHAAIKGQRRVLRLLLREAIRCAKLSTNDYTRRTSSS